MGTRNLTMVISNGKTKVAQYGQWDGYLEGQGKTVLNFLKNADLEVFKAKVDKCKFVSGKEIEKRYKALGIKGGWMTMEEAAKFKAKYPAFDRDMAAEVLQHIYTDMVNELQDSSDFAADSLFCEYAYVIDLDKGTFEIYTGFNKMPLKKGERFADMKKQKDSDYYPVKLLKSYSLAKLPTEKAFLKLEKQEA